MARPASTQSPAVAVAAVAGPAGSASAARARIDDEHRRLNELLRSLDHSHDLGRIEKLLAELETLLVAHFAGEEGDEGLHQVVGEGAAHRLPNLQRLYDEHREFVTRIARLRAECAGLVDGPVRRLHDGISALAEGLRRHERAEDELFGEAFYTDLGGRS